MRMNKLVVGLLVLGLAVAMIGLAGFAAGKGRINPLPPIHVPTASVEDNVSWTIQGFVELKIADNAFDFGTIPAGVDEVTKENANTLFVFSNTSWALTVALSGDGSDHLKVGLSADEGKRDAEISVDYTLFNLRTMDPGSYTAIVTYTVTAK